MCKGIRHIKQPAPNTACSGWWGVCAFFGRFLALGFSRFDGESALRPTTTNTHRWAVSFQDYVPLFMKAMTRKSTALYIQGPYVEGLMLVARMLGAAGFESITFYHNEDVS